MSRHKNIDGEKTRLLVGEASQINIADAAIGGMLKAIEDKILRRFSRGRKMSESDVATLHSAVLWAGRSHLEVLHEEDHTTDLSVGVSRKESFEVSFIATRRMGGRTEKSDELFQLFSVRIYGSAKLFRIDYQEHPFAFQYHAAERLIERATNIKTAFKDLADSLFTWTPFILHTRNGQMNREPCDLHLPTIEAAGLMLGDFTDAPDLLNVRIDYSTSGKQLDNIASTYTMPGMYVVRTFVGKWDLRPIQTEALARLADWMQDNEIYLYDGRTMMFMPYFDLEEESEDAPSRTVFRGDVADTADDLFKDGRLELAMMRGSTGSASTVTQRRSQPHRGHAYDIAIALPPRLDFLGNPMPPPSAAGRSTALSSLPFYPPSLLDRGGR